MLRAVARDWLAKEESITVAEAAVILGANESTVRALVRDEVLEGHRVGKNDDNPTGVRVNLQSVLNYKARHTVRRGDDRQEAAPKPAVKRRRRESSASLREAMVALRAMGSKI